MWESLGEGWYVPPAAVGREPWEEPAGAPLRPHGVPDQIDFATRGRSRVPTPEQFRILGFVWAWVGPGQTPPQESRWEACSASWVVEDAHGWWVKVDWSGRTSTVHESRTSEWGPPPERLREAARAAAEAAEGQRDVRETSAGGGAAVPFR